MLLANIKCMEPYKSDEARSESQLGGQTQTIRGLNELLRGELSAVETYSQALTVITDSDASDDLRTCQASHQDRVARLRSEIMARGGEPEAASGAWGALARLVEGGAKIIGPKMAVNTLEAGEDYGLKEYQELLPTLDPPARGIVSTALYPQQMRTHSIVSALKRSLANTV